MKQKLKCHGGCGEFAHSHGADLYCGPDCAKGAAKADKKLVKEMEAAGFKQSKKTPNLYLKKGVAISIEQVRHEGLDSVLQKLN